MTIESIKRNTLSEKEIKLERKRWDDGKKKNKTLHNENVEAEEPFKIEAHMKETRNESSNSSSSRKTTIMIIGIFIVSAKSTKNGQWWRQRQWRWLLIVLLFFNVVLCSHLAYSFNNTIKMFEKLFSLQLKQDRA